MSIRHMPDNPRIRREKAMVRAMIELYCRAFHRHAPDLCESCLALQDHAFRKIDRCPFQAAKPVCARCRIHCYRGDMRAQIRAVMRFAGPRMLLRHPVMALLHLLDGLMPRRW